MKTFILVAVLFAAKEVSSVSVTQLDVRSGSVSGGTTIGIHGSEFALDSFNFGDGNSDLGNTVIFYSDTQEYEADVDKDATDENTIICYTREMKEGVYHLKLLIDNVEIPSQSYCSGNPKSSSCSLQITLAKTPLLNSIVPATSPPGAEITLGGRLFTDKTGAADDESSNGNAASIRRIWIGGKKCEMYKDTDDLFGLTLTCDASGYCSNWGSVKCHHAGNFVGSQNVSLLIDSDYGRAQPQTNLMKISSDYQLYVYQTYAVIDSVSPIIGSKFGGTLITVTGNFFDDDSIDVTVGGETCVVEDRQDTSLTCTTPSNNDFIYSDAYPGSRGVFVEIYPGLDDAATIADVGYDDYEGDKANVTQDAAEISHTTSAGPVVARIRGFFVPATSGKYLFQSNKPSNTIIHVSTDHTMDKKALVSDMVPLVSGREYFYEVIHTEPTNTVSFAVSAYLAESDYLYGQTASAIPERQAILASSPDDKEIQKITLNNWETNETSVNEVFQLCITCAAGYHCAGEELYTLSLDKIMTKPLTSGMEATEVKRWIEQFPTLGGDTVTVEKSSTPESCYSLYTIEINSNRGSLNLQAAPVDNTSIDVELTVVNSSEASLTSFTIALDGIPSSHVPVGDAESLANAVKSLFSVSCPPGLNEQLGSDVKVFWDFEANNSPNFGGSLTTEDSYCGSQSIKNPRLFYDTLADPIALDNSLEASVCFAHKGKTAYTLTVHYTFTHIQSGLVPATYTVSSETGTDDWQYSCVALKDVKTYGDPGFGHSLTDISIALSASNYDFFLDNFFVGVVQWETEDLDVLHGMRRLPLSTIRLEGIAVERNDDEYTVTMSPFNCATGLPLLEAAYGTGAENDNNSYTYTSSSWGENPSIVIERLLASAPPIGGHFTLTLPGEDDSYGGVTDNIPWNVEPGDLEKFIESLNGVDDVSVSREGNCRSYEWSVQFERPGGRHEKLTAVGAFDNPDGTISVIEVQKGGLLLNPIPGDWLRTASPSPQVQVTINNVPSLCQSSCSFAFDDSATPTVTDVEGDNGDSVLVITGTGFSTNNDDNVVKIDGILCELTNTQATETSLECIMGAVPAGNRPLVVHVNGKGDSDTFDFPVSLVCQGSDILPVSGSAAGGTEVNIPGIGFDNSAAVEIGDSPCDVIEVTHTSIKCTTGASAVGDATVAIQMGSQSASCEFTYAFEDVTASGSISPITLTVLGGNLTFIGTGFGSESSDNSAYIGTHKATVVSWTETKVIATAPSLPQATYTVRLNIPPFGDAQLTPKEVEYVLTASTVAPTASSLMGGVELTISGNGFDDGVKVKVADNDCRIETQTATSITCIMGSCGKTHTVTNTGESAHGIGYAWNPSKLSIHAGDRVAWSWSKVAGVSGAAYQVFTTGTATGIAYDNDGFSSGNPTSEGSYVYQFNVPGVYHYGGFANGNQIFMRGVITVADAVDKSASLSVQIGDHEADYPDGPLAVSCEAGLTSTVTEISPSSGTSDDLITITGTGFSTDGTSAYVGEAECSVEFANETTITCKVGTAAGLTVGLNQEVSVKVSGKGSSRSDIRNLPSRYFVLLPHIASVSPATGSLAGGTKITITGGGLSHCTKVTLGGVACSIVSTSYTDVVCETGRSIAAPHPIAVEVVENNQLMDATCINTACSFAYESADTPIVKSVAPLSAAEPITVTITGEGFGDGSTTSVIVGETKCNNPVVDGDTISCTVDGLPVGQNVVQVHVEGKGYADTAGEIFSILSESSISSVSSNAGSIHGGTTITIHGNGFVVPTVTIGDSACTVSDFTLSSITCVTAASSTGSKILAVRCNNQEYEPQTFEYSDENTPVVTGIEPPRGIENSIITLTGNALIEADPTVLIGGIACTDAVVSTASGDAESTIQCKLGSRYGGEADVVVNAPVYGYATVEDGVGFEYLFEVDSVSPSKGSLGGGQSITIYGNGFSSLSELKICDQKCSVTGEVTATAITCITPESSEATTCDIVVTNTETDSRTLVSAYTYDTLLTPEVASVEPLSGGTGGGTRLTISGNGLSGVTAVNIDGSVCVIDSATLSPTSFQCTTESHKGTKNAKVEVRVGDNGIAPTENANFYYVDRWSSIFTWGGTYIPQEGEFITIQEGETVLLDTVTAQLSMLLINGGHLIFEDGRDDVVHLHADNILITGGGLLQVGTEDNPFQSNAEITMHGHLRSQELPLYGAKTLGVREGRLEMHGKIIDNTWTLLEETAAAGSNQIKLQIPVTWPVGAEVVIASTGLRHSQIENEQHEITAITVEDGKSVLTLKENLKYEHLGITESYVVDGETITYDYRGEVGLLTRNIKFQGSDDISWHDEIKRCAAGFNTGQFATQTCFQGRFGEEEGSDEYGGSIMIHSKSPTKDPDNGLAIAHIEYVELNYVGQAYRLGRYPIHWHLMGNMTGNYVRGCAIHKSFNRAVTIHGTHNLLVERNVVYNVMGGAIFIEDGIETNNVIQYNLVVFVRQSTSLLNDDITPAAYWVTNPDNIIRHNHAAGGTHFGYWYRMHTHPDGPSYTPSVCQQNVELGIFRNNSAHSQGWYGLWIFQTYLPKEGGSCWSNVPMAAKFHSLKTWHCEKGAEWVMGGAIQFHEFALSSNEKLGLDIRNVIGTEWDKGDRGALIANNVIIGHAYFWEAKNPNYETGTGIVMPLNPGFWMDGVTFININRGSNAAISGGGHKCSGCGGFHYRIENARFLDVTARVKWRWEHEGIIVDLDGSLTGIAGAKLVPSSDIYNDGVGCVLSDEEKFGANAGRPSSLCQPDVSFHRFAFNGISPSGLKGSNLILQNEYGNSSVPNLFLRKTHPEGWMAVLRGRETYTMSFKNAADFTNISYSGAFYDVTGGDYVIMKQQLTVKPDRIFMYSGEGYKDVASSDELTASSAHRAWHYDIDTGEFSYKIGVPDSTSTALSTYSVSPNIFRCFFVGCVPPEDTGSLPDVNNPEGVIITVTNFTSQECFVVTGETDDDRVVGIPKNCWVFWAIPDSTLNRLLVQGSLQFSQDLESITLTATYIIVEGRMIGGRHTTDPHRKLLHIKMRGNKTTDYYPTSHYLAVGAKTIACLGVCDLHGLDKGIAWTKLAEPVPVGSKQLVLDSPVEWDVDDEIVIAPSGFNAWHTEKNIISGFSEDGRTLFLKNAIKYEHTAGVQDFGNGWLVDMSAEVGVLTRNIKIEGEFYDDILDEAFGARVLVNTVAEETAKIRFSNVEFYHSGQQEDVWNPSHSIALYQAGLGSEVFRCAFHDGFSPAIGTYGTVGVNITENVVHHTVGDGIVIAGDFNTLESNLVLLNTFAGSYLNKTEEDSEYTAAIKVESGFFTKMSNNVVAGAERCAYRIVGQSCTSSLVPSWSGNVGHATLVGIFQMTAYDGCSLINGFTIYKALDYGIYHQTTDSVQIQNSAIIDATVGYLPLVAGPSALSHEIAKKYARISKSLFVGRSDQTDCSVDVNENTDHSLILRSKQKARKTPSGGRSAIMLPMFESGSNGATKKAMTANKQYPAIYGVLEVVDVTVSNFGTLTSSGCSGITDVLFITNPNNEDASHPVHITGLVQNNVEINSYAYIDRPNRGKINPSDCVDMPCDAKLKVVIKDTDGSLFGYSGSIISQSEKDWGSQSLGVGDFRIPKTMLTTPDGQRIPVDELVPDKGIARTDACQYNEKWQGYECAGVDAFDYLTLVIESLDGDTETRRLSPVAIKVGTYIDLLNGPQDHGWCGGYTCQKRISTFHAVVPANQHIDLYFTSTPPQRTRFHLLNGKATDKVTIGVWIPNPQKLDVSDGTGAYVRPTNAYDGADGKMRLEKPSVGDPDEFKPNPDTANPGDNYLDFETRVLYVCVGGEHATLTIVTKPTIIVSFGFPAITVNELFEENIEIYLAALLNIPANKIRRVNVVRETSRKKRSADTVTVSLEVEADTAEEANKARTTLTDAFQRETVSIEGNQPSTLTATKALTPELITELDEVLQSDRYAGNVDEITVPTKISLVTTPSGEEASVLNTSPKIHILDDDDNLVITSTTWTVTVTMDVSHPNADPLATLEGTKTLPFVNGVAEFNDLVISHSGTYKLIFTPSESKLAVITSDDIELNVRTISASITRLEQSGKTTAGSELKFDLQLTDGSSNNLQNLDFKGYTYKIDVSFDDASLYGKAILTGPTTFEFDANGRLTTEGLFLNGTENYFVYNLKFTLYTDPASSYNLVVEIEKIQIYPSDTADYTHEDVANQKNLEIKFSVDYDSALGTTPKETFEIGFYNELVPLHSALYIAPFTSEKTADGKLKFHTIVMAKNESLVTEFIENLKTTRSLRSGDTVIGLDNSCGIAVNGICEASEETTMAMDTTTAGVSIADDFNTTTVILAVLGACVFLAICILVTTYLVKRYQVSKIAAMRCMDSSPMSQRPLHDTLDSFTSGSQDTLRDSQDFYSLPHAVA